MIERIVRLRFLPGKRDAFLDIFAKHLLFMKELPGCVDLQLLYDSSDLDTFFTQSTWESELALQDYRSSEYFRDIWGTIKPWFVERAHAWTLEKVKFDK